MQKGFFIADDESDLNLFNILKGKTSTWNFEVPS